MTSKIRSLAIFACFFLIVTFGLSAQSPRELRFETEVSGTLQGDEQWFSVRPAQTGFVIVETTSDIDTFLEAYDAFENYIGSDDDSGDDYNARLQIFAEAGKTYLFKLRGWGEDDVGPYTIQAGFKVIPPAMELRFGASFPGNLRAGDEQWFSVRPPASGYVVVETSGNLDTYLEAHDSSYNFIDGDDDGGEDLNARVEIFTHAGQTYLFLLKAYDEEESGAYRIWASFEPIPPDTDYNTDRSRAVPISLGEGVTSYFRSESETRWYRYEVTRSGALFVFQTRGNLDTVMTLYDSQGNTIEEDDDSGEGGNALLSLRLNPGTVYIEVREYSGQQGRFSVHAEIR